MLTDGEQRAEAALRSALGAYGVDDRAMAAEEGPSAARRICAALSAHPFGSTMETGGGKRMRMTHLAPEAFCEILSALRDELVWGTQSETALAGPLGRVLEAYRAYHDESVPPEKAAELVDAAIGGQDAHARRP